MKKEEDILLGKRQIIKAKNGKKMGRTGIKQTSILVTDAFIPAPHGLSLDIKKDSNRVNSKEIMMATLAKLEESGSPLLIYLKVSSPKETPI